MAALVKFNNKGKQAEKHRFSADSSPIVGSVNKVTVSSIFSFIASVMLCVFTIDS
jgi:hypothetical protein